MLVALALIATGAVVQAQPGLHLVDDSPLVVHGVGFVPGEQVTVVVIVHGRHERLVTVAAAGSFTARFAGVSLEQCLAYVIRATGSRGDHAYLRRIPDCAKSGTAP